MRVCESFDIVVSARRLASTGLDRTCQTLRQKTSEDRQRSNWPRMKLLFGCWKNFAAAWSPLDRSPKPADVRDERRRSSENWSTELYRLAGSLRSDIKTMLSRSPLSLRAKSAFRIVGTRSPFRDRFRAI